MTHSYEYIYLSDEEYPTRLSVPSDDEMERWPNSPIEKQKNIREREDDDDDEQRVRRGPRIQGLPAEDELMLLERELMRRMSQVTAHGTDTRNEGGALAKVYQETRGYRPYVGPGNGNPSIADAIRRNRQ